MGLQPQKGKVRHYTFPNIQLIFPDDGSGLWWSGEQFV